MFALYSMNDDNNSDSALYIQLYNHIREEILSGNAKQGERLPSLRSVAQQTGLSVTTAGLAYDQLQTEGYISSRPRSGYYVAEIPETETGRHAGPPQAESSLTEYTAPSAPYLYDLDAFDFRGWKKCVNRVYNDYAHLLLSGGDLQGEAALRYEIARYVYEARGVRATPEQVVIGAGTQQLMAHISRILKQQSIRLVSVEDPGYLPIRRMLRDNGFSLAPVPVMAEGIDLTRLPVNIASAVYVSPANQFPTGAVMPVANRYKLLQWAEKNNSIILEDDYNSELRYFGRPIPALQGMDTGSRVIYLGSFSSTLFPAVRISYMILPERLMPVFTSARDHYLQTCSKTEQLTLALFMEEGLYHKNIRKIRTLYARKLSMTIQAFQQYGQGQVTPRDTRSGISLLLETAPGLDTPGFCRRGEALGLRIVPLIQETPEKDLGRWNTGTHMIFYYNQIPLPDITHIIHELCTI